MISINLWFEITTPTGEVVQRLPVFPGELVIGGISKVFAVDVVEIKVNGQPNEVKARRCPSPGSSVQFRLFGRTDNLADGNFKTLVMDVIEKTREEPSE